MDGALLAVSQPVEGRAHDKTAYTRTGLADLLTDTTVIADLGHQDTPTLRPRRKRPGHRRRTPADKTWNTSVSRIRWAVEHAIAHLKNWKILATGYRARLAELPTILRISSPRSRSSWSTAAPGAPATKPRTHPEGPRLAQPRRVRSRLAHSPGRTDCHPGITDPIQVTTISDYQGEAHLEKSVIMRRTSPFEIYIGNGVRIK
ncbi:transposase family protein [Saccharothrix sp. HUAS TT1]|uniref:transposase family protein n=1 Tax=unclassified Saccharothrix TaxID=2593673 RepID=UPI00345C252B